MGLGTLFVRLDSFRIRLSLMGIGAVAVCVYLLAGGRIGPGNLGTIQIEYGTYPEAFEGLQVAIDGEVAGALKPFGAATRTVFAVREGRHLVRVKSTQYGCRGRIVNVESGHTMVLVLDVGTTSNAGVVKPEIYIQ